MRNDKLVNTSVSALLVLWRSWQEGRYCDKEFKIGAINCEVCTFILKWNHLSTPACSYQFPFQQNFCLVAVVMPLSTEESNWYYTVIHSIFFCTKFGLNVAVPLVSKHCLIVPFRCAVDVHNEQSGSYGSNFRSVSKCLLRISETKHWCSFVILICCIRATSV